MVTRPVTHSLPERQVLGDMDEDLPEEEIVKRKVEAINAMVAYAFESDPAKRAEPERRAEPVPTLSSDVALPMPTRQPTITADTEPVPMLPHNGWMDKFSAQSTHASRQACALGDFPLDVHMVERRNACLDPESSHLLPVPVSRFNGVPTTPY